MKHTAHKHSIVEDPNFGTWTITSAFHTGEVHRTLTRSFFRSADLFAYITLLSSEGIELPREREAQILAFEDYQKQLEEHSLQHGIVKLPTRNAIGYKAKPLSSELAAQVLSDIDSLL